MIDQLREARWFGGKNRPIRDTRVVDRACWADNAAVFLVDVSYADGPPETYVFADRLEQPEVARAVLRQFQGANLATDAGGTLVFQPTHVLATIPLASAEPIALMLGEQSNTSIRFGDAFILKLFRRLQFGANPDVEIGRFLTERSRFRGSPAVMGSVDYLSPNGQHASVALLQRFEANRGDAWTTTLRRLAAVLDGHDPGESVAAMSRLAQTTAELHLALASGEGDFSAQRISADDAESWRLAIHDEVHLATVALGRRGIDLDAADLLQRAAGISGLEGALKTRHHGDYHLGQVLERDDGSLTIIDFEGEPSKPLHQRREKRSPLRDVAGMLRSFDYARNAALRAEDVSDEYRIRRAETWYSLVRQKFVDVYAEVIQSEKPELLPHDIAGPLAAMELDKAAYEVLYELNNRPEWLPIPLAALNA